MVFLPERSFGLRTVLNYVWTIGTTVSTLVLGIMVYASSAESNESSVASNRLLALGQLDALMLETRTHFDTYCIRESQSYKLHFQARYGALVAAAGVAPSTPPYDQPCRVVEGGPPNPITSLSVSVSMQQLAPRYEDWNSFIAAENKKSRLWVGGVPIDIDVSVRDWKSQEAVHRSMLEQIENCRRAEHYKVKNTFMQIDCQWGIDDDDNPTMVTIEIH